MTNIYFQAETISIDVTKNHLMVLDPQTNVMLTGPNAPTTATLEDWLKVQLFS